MSVDMILAFAAIICAVLAIALSDRKLELVALGVIFLALAFII